MVDLVLRSLFLRCLAEATVMMIGRGTPNHHSLCKFQPCLCQILHSHWSISIRGHIRLTATCLVLSTITTKGQWEERRVWGCFMFQVFPPAPPCLVPVWGKGSRVNPRIWRSNRRLLPLQSKWCPLLTHCNHWKRWRSQGTLRQALLLHNHCQVATWIQALFLQWIILQEWKSQGLHQEMLPQISWALQLTT
jgi:hypothetical protein